MRIEIPGFLRRQNAPDSPLRNSELDKTRTLHDLLRDEANKRGISAKGAIERLLKTALGKLPGIQKQVTAQFGELKSSLGGNFASLDPDSSFGRYNEAATTIAHRAAKQLDREQGTKIAPGILNDEGLRNLTTVQREEYVFTVKQLPALGFPSAAALKVAEHYLTTHKPADLLKVLAFNTDEEKHRRIYIPLTKIDEYVSGKIEGSKRPMPNTADGPKRPASETRSSKGISLFFRPREPETVEAASQVESQQPEAKPAREPNPVIFQSLEPIKGEMGETIKSISDGRWLKDIVEKVEEERSKPTMEVNLFSNVPVERPAVEVLAPKVERGRERFSVGRVVNGVLDNLNRGAGGFLKDVKERKYAYVGALIGGTAIRLVMSETLHMDMTTLDMLAKLISPGSVVIRIAIIPALERSGRFKEAVNIIRIATNYAVIAGMGWGLESAVHQNHAFSNVSATETATNTATLTATHTSTATVTPESSHAAATNHQPSPSPTPTPTETETPTPTATHTPTESPTPLPTKTVVAETPTPIPTVEATPTPSGVVPATVSSVLPPAEATQVVPAQVIPSTTEVSPGDTLHDIVERKFGKEIPNHIVTAPDVQKGIDVLAEENHLPDRDLIHPGEHLSTAGVDKLVQEAAQVDNTPFTYQLKPGDTITDFVEKYMAQNLHQPLTETNVSQAINSVIDENGITDPRTLQIGQVVHYQELTKLINSLNGG